MRDIYESEEKTAQNELSRRKRDREDGDLRKILSIPEGRRLIWKILSETGIYRSSFTGNSETFYNEGRRRIGLFILEEIMKVKPEAYTQMQQEAAFEAKAEAKALAKKEDFE